METGAPTVLWRLFKVPGEHARAVMLPGGPPYTLAFFSNDQMDRVENFDALEIALFRADEIRRSLMDDGFVEDQ
ncbi:MAG: hypothetical protein Q8L75_18835 [Acidobacteriota bacterium]|nr:hypothetical protein [Acidobacteriota bacterium]